MKTPNLNIDKRQLIILVVSGLMLVILLVYWQFLYLPKKRDIVSILAKVKDFDVNIKEEEARIKAQGYEEEIARMQEEITRLQNKFPSQNEIPALFQELFKQADKFNIEIISIQPKEPSIYKSQSEQKSDLIFNKVPIRLKLRADYRSLALFLKALFENEQYAFSFEDLNLEKKKGSDLRLEVDLLLGAFILSHEGAVSMNKELDKGLNLRRGRK